MAVLANNSEGSSVPPEMAQNLEVDDDYNKYTPSAEYSTAGRNIFRNKKFTKKRHESKARRTDHTQDATNVCGSDEDYPQASTSRNADLHMHGSIPKILLSINHTIQNMTIKDTITPTHGPPPTIPEGVATTTASAVDAGAGGDSTSVGMSWRDAGIGESTTNLEVDEVGQQHRQYASNHSSSCNLHPQPQGKRRRHRRKQQYKRMAVDAHTSPTEKTCLQLKLPTSNSSEDSGIGKRKRNINLNPVDCKGACSPVGIARVSVPVPVVPQSAGASSLGQPTMESVSEHRLPWGIDADNDDAVMMDYEEIESNSNTKVVTARSDGIVGTEEETGESDTQNDDIESLSDNNQDADDEESDYYNNDSSTTSLSESSFTVLNSSSKKFIPVHSREIRAGRRRLKDNYFGSIENEEVSKFIQTPSDTVLKVFPSSERERLDFMSIANRYSLSLEEGCEQEDQRVWVQFTKTKTTNTQRKNDLIKAAIGERFTESSSLAVNRFLDSFVNEEEECNEISDDCVDNANTAGVGNTLIRGGVCANQLVNSKRIKKGS